MRRKDRQRFPSEGSSWKDDRQFIDLQDVKIGISESQPVTQIEENFTSLPVHAEEIKLPQCDHTARLSEEEPEILTVCCMDDDVTEGSVKSEYVHVSDAKKNAQPAIMRMILSMLIIFFRGEKQLTFVSRKSNMNTSGKHYPECPEEEKASEKDYQNENMKKMKKGPKSFHDGAHKSTKLQQRQWEGRQEQHETNDSTCSRVVMKGGKTKRYLQKDVYSGDPNESDMLSNDDIPDSPPTFMGSLVRVSLSLLFLVSSVLVLYVSLKRITCSCKEGSFYVLDVKVNAENVKMCVVWTVMILISVTLLQVFFCVIGQNFSKLAVSKVLYNMEQKPLDSTSGWPQQSSSEVSKSLHKWYLDWFPESVGNFCTKIVANPASQGGSLEQYFTQKFSGLALSEKEEMKYEWLRLQSFQNWPTWAIPFPSVLAKAGFWYTKSGDRVACFSCEGVVEGWRQDMKPMDVHREKFPHCKFVAGQEENVPILPMDSSEVSPAVSGILGQTGASRPALNTERSAQPVSESSRNDSGLPSTRDSITAGPTGMHASVAQASTDQRDSGFADAARSSDVTEGVSGSFINRMKHEHNRYLTYRSWPSTNNTQPKLLAKAGFYYTGLNFKVLCAFCNGMLDYSEPEQEPMDYHRELFPNCPFVRSPHSVNIPAYPPVAPAGPNPPPAVQTDLAMLGIMSDSPKHPEFTLLQARIDSFRGWMPEREQKPYDLAVAGFIYAGMSDCVKCFQCDGGLRNWLPGDIPWVEHARWFPQCSHVRLCKGQEFIDTIEEMYPRNGAASGNSSTIATRSNTIANGSSRNVDQLMSSPAAQSVLEMGYTQDLVRRGLETLLRQNGTDTGVNAHELVETLLELPDVTGDVSHQDDEQQPSATQQQPGELVGATGHKSLPNLPRNNSLIVDESEIGEELDTKSLREKNRELIEQTLCKICLENKMCITFLPCGHLVSCAECAPALRKCPICRSTIKGRVRVYMS